MRTLFLLIVSIVSCLLFSACGNSKTAPASGGTKRDSDQAGFAISGISVSNTTVINSSTLKKADVPMQSASTNTDSGLSVEEAKQKARMIALAVRIFDTPMTYEEAGRHEEIQFPFPKSAKNIQYGIYSFWQAYGLAVRFNAPVDDCLILAHGLMEKHCKSSYQPLSYSVVSVTNVPSINPGLPTPVPWFSPQTIRRGLHITSTNALPPRIWIDLDTQTFYLNETD